MIDTDAYLPARPDTVRWGRLPARGFAPVTTITSGTTITVDTVSHEGVLDDQGRDPRAFFSRFGVDPGDVLADAIAIAADLKRDPAVDGPHVVCGPIGVKGAEPGDVLEVEFVDLRRRVEYGVISNRHGKGALPGEMPEHGEPIVSRFATVVDSPHGPKGQLVAPGGAVARWPLAPFVGIVGVAVDRDDEPSSVPPGDHGGNLDIRHLGATTKLYLPVQLAGAGLYLSDPHFSQGDGEVALTAFEAPLQATVRVTVHKEAAAGWAGPFGSDDGHWIVPGLHVDLNEAVKIATRRALALLGPLGFDRATALAYLSAAADMHVTQVVDGVKGVHFRIRRADLGDERPLPTMRW
ncbi:MAG: acetamidase/formamidase family protein [Acidimicrobiia bacterium]